DGMSYSLQSREIIADSIETAMSAHWYDANISIPGCDKNMPGCLIAMGRLNRPALMVYGGTIKPGCVGDKVLDIVSAFQSYGEYLAGAISEEERRAIVRHSCPGAGACGGMYTANTMASAAEAIVCPGEAVTTGVLMRSVTWVGCDVREREIVSMARP
ncbi:MAG: dihydroxy-acid dehydratase, partial [Anaerolineales bacterium]|nr:dihydroxy-acid dehydratase [Anaerolineales bacterium]